MSFDVWQKYALSSYQRITKPIINGDFSPFYVPNMAVWFKGGSVLVDGSDRIEKAVDMSGNGLDATQPTDDNKPVKVAAGLKGNDTMQGDGVNDFLTFARSFQNNLSVYLVIKRTKNAAQQWIISNDNSATTGGGLTVRFSTDNSIRFWNGQAADAVDSSAITINTWNVVSCISDAVGATNKIYVNKLADGSKVRANAGRNEKATTRIFHSEVLGGYLQGEISEIIIYLDAHSSETRNTIECYLTKKYI